MRNAGIALTAAGHIAVEADQAGGALHAILFSGHLALIVCVIFAHLRPVFYAVRSTCGISRNLSDALAKLV
jgi:hypothetical protein